MRDSVRRAFVGFTSKFEGVVDCMYLDIKGLVTTAIGNLIDPVQMCAGLPFVHADGSPASWDAIENEWHMIKGNPVLSRRGWRAAKAIASLHLTPDGIAQVVGAKLALNDAQLAHRFPDYEAWPADAQLFANSMAWACGANFHFPKLEAALRAQDFIAASLECHMDDSHNQGLVPRNAANLVLLHNAAKVVADGLDRDVLWYPEAA